jgi:hypothetical protein
MWVARPCSFKRLSYKANFQQLADDPGPNLTNLR